MNYRGIFRKFLYVLISSLFFVSSKIFADKKHINDLERRVVDVRRSMYNDLKGNDFKNISFDVESFSERSSWPNWGNWGNWGKWNNWNNWAKWAKWNDWSNWQDFSNWQKFSNY
ncbi:hypothetical protein [Neptunitalea lumnitzerae]|uniref:Uncharacterized protein n=1 Tax=Neptunitalea lumnitzerae TaxID=2965509 RepID=A0ABQ5ME97_9FLAO|nr:hypothetical protein [Neptunitalea sp. Y10]GLB47702.1 hypothetical protein Y10_00700 [Neptunitalea sp. Y10]